MEQINLVKNTSEDIGVSVRQVEAVLNLTLEGCTIPFIARYRKEKTGNLDETQISSVIETYNKIEEREKRREYILKFLGDEGKLEKELEKRIKNAKTVTELEDLYLPFKPRKKTLADKAAEKGLMPLAETIIANKLNIESAEIEAEKFLSEEVASIDEALDGAYAILVQKIVDDADSRQFTRETLRKGVVASKVKRGKKEEGEKFQDYFEFNESITKIASHRLMALQRGVNENILNISIEPSSDPIKLAEKISDTVFSTRNNLFLDVSEIALEKYLIKSIGNEVLKESIEVAEKDSVEIFRKNLEQILMFSPFGEKAVIAVDPGIRTGCKVSVLSETGEFLEYQTLFLHTDPGSAKKIANWVQRYNIKGVAVGDGTFGREALAIIRKECKGMNVTVASVDEDGASIYSASEIAREEFPDIDLTVRGAISIGRRFQDPMAELVKIDPKSLGVGQYQHDVNKKLLQEKLTQTVEWAVNKVGVNVNTSSYHLLSYISGLDKKKAKELVGYRNSIGKFKNRNEFKKVKGIGPKAYEQSAGFLRIIGGANPLDETGIHPEQYKSIKEIARFYGTDEKTILSSSQKIEKSEIRKSLQIEELDSILFEIKNRGEDPREPFKSVDFNDAISSIGDLSEGMVLPGVVDNIVAFGAFIDLGIKEKGLVHISEISDTFIKDVTEFLKVGEEVKAKVISIDTQRKRIGLSLKQV